MSVKANDPGTSRELASMRDLAKSMGKSCPPRLPPNSLMFATQSMPIPRKLFGLAAAVLDQRAAGIVLDRARRVDPVEGQADARRGLASILEAGEASDVVAPELRDPARAKQHRHDHGDPGD